LLATQDIVHGAISTIQLCKEDICSASAVSLLDIDIEVDGSAKVVVQVGRCLTLFFHISVNKDTIGIFNGQTAFFCRNATVMNTFDVELF